MDSRQQFEEWYTQEMIGMFGETVRGQIGINLAWSRDDGSYADPMLRLGLMAWQASRESLVIEMPQLYDWAVGEAGVFQDDDGTLFDSSSIIELLHSAGIRTK